MTMKIFFSSVAALLGLTVLSGLAFPPSSPVRPPAWIVQTSGTSAGLRGLSAVDERIAWASGTNGTVVRTVDGGTTWTAVPVSGAEKIDFRDIEAFSAETAVVMGVGEPARIFRTEDGGRTWTQTYFNDTPGIFLDAMAFFDQKNGLAVGDPLDGRFFLIRTADGGKSWSLLPPESRPPALAGEAAFAASGTALVTRDDGLAWIATGGAVSRILRSEDGGLRWEAAPSGLKEGAASTGAFSVFFFDARAGLAVGGDYQDEASDSGNAAVSDDGGRTWTTLSGRRPGGFREAAAAAPGAGDIVAVGPSGSDYSPDGGKTWIPMDGPAGFHTVGFARSGRAAWAAGRNGLIARLELR